MIYLMQIFIVFSIYFISIYLLSNIGVRLFLTMFTISVAYYGIGGAWYWQEFRDGEFLGVNWNDQIERMSYIFFYVYIYVVLCLFLFSFYKNKVTVIKKQNEVILFDENLIIKVLGIIGILASVYVLIVGADVASGEYTSDPLLLIAYQFSDILIAIILFKYATGENKFFWAVFCLLYILFAGYVGLRYKIALLAGPVLIYEFIRPGENRKMVRYCMGFFAILGVFSFSLMTIARQKFSGVDLSIIAAANFDDYIYGLFAETNLIFGLASAITNFGSKFNFVGLQPIYDVFIQYIPRFFYPDKNLYQHLVSVMYGLGASKEALDSGTAIPFFGEYFVMWGWTGVIVGVFFYVYCLMLMLKTVFQNSMNNSHILMGEVFVSVFLGYYYFSRGSLAQISKGYIFIFLIYILLLKSNSKIEDKLVK